MASEKPSGRSLRSKLTDEFVTALAADFEQHGQAALQRVRLEAPGRYAELVAKLVPTEIAVTQGNPCDGMTRDEGAAYLTERMSHNVEAYEEILRRARKLAKEREAALPVESEINKRARLASVERNKASRRAQLRENGPWTD